MPMRKLHIADWQKNRRQESISQRFCLLHYSRLARFLLARFYREKLLSISKSMDPDHGKVITGKFRTTTWFAYCVQRDAWYSQVFPGIPSDRSRLRKVSDTGLGIARALPPNNETSQPRTPGTRLTLGESLKAHWRNERDVPWIPGIPEVARNNAGLDTAV